MGSRCLKSIAETVLSVEIMRRIETKQPLCNIKGNQGHAQQKETHNLFHPGGVYLKQTICSCFSIPPLSSTVPMLILHEALLNENYEVNNFG